MNQHDWAVFDMVDLGRSGVAIGAHDAPPIPRLALVPHPADRLAELYRREVEQVGGPEAISRWAVDRREDDMTKSAVEWLGRDWYRYRLDDVLFWLADMDLVVRSDRLPTLTATLGDSVALCDPVPLDSNDPDRVQFRRDTELANPSDTALYRAAGSLETRLLPAWQRREQ